MRRMGRRYLGKRFVVFVFSFLALLSFFENLFINFLLLHFSLFFNSEEFGIGCVF